MTSKENDKVTFSDRAFAGSLAGFSTRFFSQPLDVLKIRFQIQLQPLLSSSQTSLYKGIYQGLCLIIDKEGPSALWKGHGAAQALSISYGMFQFTAFGSLFNLIQDLMPQMSPFRGVVDFSSGFGGGCIATILSYPFDTIRTRLVVQGEPKVYRGILDAAMKMTAKEGVGSLYRGLWPTLLQIGPYTGFQFSLYHSMVDAYDRLIVRDDQEIGKRSLVCGAVSGAVAKTLVYPLDLSKKRLQVQNFSQNHQYRGLLHCLWKTARTEGLLAWYKGLSPSILKALLSSALHFYFYEKSLRYLQVWRIS